MKSLATVLIILCLLIAALMYSSCRKTAPVESLPVPTNQPPVALPPGIASNPPPPPPPLTNEVPETVKSDIDTNVSALAVALAVADATNPPPAVMNAEPEVTNVTIVPVLTTNVFETRPLEEVVQEHTNRLTLSLRYGLNISGKFRNVGSSFSSGTPLAAGRRTPNGDPYNYDNGYVLTDISGNFGGQTWYWGYDSASQVNAGANTIAFNHTVATGLPSQNSSGDSAYVGAELAYDYELGVKEDWHHLRYGVEGAANFMPIEFNSGGHFNAMLSQRTDTYSYASGTTPPTAPYHGSFGGPGFVINVPPISSTTALIPGATLIAQQHFEANLWGFRLGPYAEWPISRKLDLYFTGGLAAGLIDGEASWKETLVLPGGGGSLAASGSGQDLGLLWGYYLSLEAAYRLTERWSVEAGAQFQDLGAYSHDFGGRTAELDLSQSIFVHAGIGYSF